MPTLFVLTGKLVGRSFDVEKDVVLGRGETCGVRLPDPSVSREHAKLEQDDDGDWWLVDLGSRNGVKVNDAREERTLLKDLDELMLGELLLRFRVDVPADAAPPAPAPAPAPAPPPAPAADDDDGGFELEEEIELGETRATPQAASRPTSGNALGRGPRATIRVDDEPEPEAAPRPEIELTDRDRERARLLSERRGGGVFSGDLSQWPAPLRWAAYLAVLLATVGICYGMYRVVLAMRGVS